MEKCIFIYVLDIFTLSTWLHQYHSNFILFHKISSCFYVQNSNLYFHYLNTFPFIVTRVIMTSTIHQYQYHELCHKFIQHYIIQLNIKQWLCTNIAPKKQKTSNTNNFIQVIINHRQSSNKNLSIVPKLLHDNNLYFSNFNYKYIPILWYKIFDLIEQAKDHQLSYQHLRKTNISLEQICLLNIMSRRHYHNAVFDNVMRWAIHWNKNNTYFVKKDVYQIQLCNILLNHLSKLYDMQNIKPTQKTIAISDASNDIESVIVFDLKQQISLLDKQLMNSTY